MASQLLLLGCGHIGLMSVKLSRPLCSRVIQTVRVTSNEALHARHALLTSAGHLQE